MKKKIQKYLSGEREGFSLVELIIVIAIMAILIGVIALAVIPYLARSRESKDLQALGAVSSALASAVANVQATQNGDFKYDGTTSAGTDEKDKVNNEMVKLLGSGSTKLSYASDAEIWCKYNVSSNTIVVYAKGSDGNVVTLDTNVTGYSDQDTKDPEGKALVVSN